MYLQLPNGNLLNLDLVTDVIFHELDKSATLMGYGVVLAANSKAAFRYFKSLPSDRFVVVPDPIQ
jgi:hypothetical protein